MDKCRYETPQPETSVQDTCGLNLVGLSKVVSDSVVKTVSPEGGLGSGFVVSNGAENLIVTDEHNLDDDSSQLEIRHLGKSYAATVVARDHERDLAILRTDKNLSKPPAHNLLPRLDIPAKDEPVVAFGFPLGVNAIQLSPGKIREQDFFYTNEHVLNSTQACNFGSSGSIQVGKDGRWWGIQQAIGPHYECISLSAINVVELLRKIPGWQDYARYP